MIMILPFFKIRGGGIMILFDQLGLVQIFEDDEVELRFISRSP